MIIKTIGKKLMMYTPIGAVSMDPITSTQNAICAFFNFLATPAGQTAAQRFLEIDKFFHQKLVDLFNKIHNKAQATPDSPAVVPTAMVDNTATVTLPVQFPVLPTPAK